MSKPIRAIYYEINLPRLSRFHERGISDDFGRFFVFLKKEVFLQ